MAAVIVVGLRYTPRRDPPVQVLSWPRPYAENPYLERLTEALARQGTTSRSARYLVELALARSDARWLHLHWPEWMLRDRSRARARARALWFFALLDSFVLRGVRVAWTAHNLVGHDEPHQDLALELRRAFLRRCALVHGHFASAERSVRELGFRGDFVLAGHPHALDDYQASGEREDVRRRLGFADGERVLVCFGSIERYKGFDRVAAAFARGCEGADRLVIAGRAGDARSLKALEAAAERSTAIEIRQGFLSRTESADLVLAADAVVLGYRQFFTSGTAMLALSHGTPVLGPPVHHLADLVGRSFFVSLDDPEQLAPAVARWREAMDARGDSIRREARAWASEFTYDAMAKALSDAFARSGTP